MWKLLTGVIAEEIYNYLEREKKRHTNLSMAWINYRKAYDLVPHSWAKEYMEMFGIAESLRPFLQKSMQQWRLSLMAKGEDLGEVNVKRGIFQGDSLSPLLCHCL